MAVSLQQSKCFQVLGIGALLVFVPRAGQAEVCCRNAETHTCATSADRSTCETSGGQMVYAGACVAGDCQKRSSQGCSASGSLSAFNEFFFDAGGSCDLSLAFSFGGATFDTATTVPLEGTLQLAVTPTHEPQVFDVRVVDNSGLAHPVFAVAGHQVAVAHMQFLEQRFVLDLRRQVDNVTGPYSLRFELLVDGIPSVLFERGNLVATFDPISRDVPAFTTVGSLFRSLLDIPMLSLPGFAVTILLLGAVGIRSLRRRGS